MKISIRDIYTQINQINSSLSSRVIPQPANVPIATPSLSSPTRSHEKPSTNIKLILPKDYLRTVKGIWNLWSVGCTAQCPLSIAFDEKLNMMRGKYSWQENKLRKLWIVYKVVIAEIIYLKSHTSFSEIILVDKLQKNMKLTTPQFACCISAVHCTRKGQDFSLDIKRLGDIVQKFLEEYKSFR
jgi:hypothetical protein